MSNMELMPKTDEEKKDSKPQLYHKVSHSATNSLEKAISAVTNSYFSAGQTLSNRSDANAGTQPLFVGLYFAIDQLAEISTVHQSYTVICKLSIDWEASVDDLKNFRADADKYVPTIIPRMDIRNSVEISKWIKSTLIASNQYVIRPGDKSRKATKGKFYNFRRWEIWGVFSENFELENFPFDVQDLTFVFESSAGWNVNRMVLEESHVEQQSFLLDLTYASLAEWEYCFQDSLFKNIDWKYEKYGVPDDDGTWKTSTAFFRLQFRRKPLAVLVRVILWMFLLSLSSFAIFALSVVNIEERLNFAITLILATIAFQFVISSELPHVPYLTLVDKYNLCAFAFLVSIVVETVFLGWQSDTDGGSNSAFSTNDAKDYDNYFAGFLFILFGINQIVFIFYVIEKRKEENWKIGKSIQELKAADAKEELEDDYDPNKPLNYYELRATEIKNKD